MPGTPYLEKPPKGLMTWPKLLKISIPILTAITVAAWCNEILLEWGIALIIILKNLGKTNRIFR